jgi:methionyl-tRNA formyltransferase
MDLVGQDARTLHNKVRGFAGWPGTKAKFEVRKDGDDEGAVIEVKIITTTVVSDAEAGKEATSANGAVEFTKKSMRVPCGGGDWLEVLELQPPGKKAMRAGDYANGMKGSALTVVSYGDDE